MNKIIKLSTALFLLSSTSYFSQGDIDEMTTIKPKVTYHFDGVNFESMSLIEIKPKSVKASSSLASKTDAYKVENLIDHNNKTAWVEGQDDSGVGASVIFEFSDINDYPDVIEIFPGYGKDVKTWEANVKPVSINVTLLNENKDENEPIESYSLSFNFENGKLPMKSQFIDIATFHLHNMALTEFKYIKFEIMEIADDGVNYKDMCISTINFYKGDKVLQSFTAEEYKNFKK